MPRPNAFRIRQRTDDNGTRKPFWVDTRFFVVETRFYRKHLASAYRNVDVTARHFIEHVYCERLATIAPPRRFRFGVTPEIRGVSGSTGVRR